MPYFPSVNKEDSLASVLGKFNTGIEKPLMMLHHQLLRGEDSPLTVAEREMIAGYVSGLTSCSYCEGIHSRIAEQFGMKEGIVKEMLNDLEKADIDEKFKPLLRYIRKVTLTPAKIVETDVQDALDAGWSERAIYDALMVCCTFNFVNRMVNGMGLEITPEKEIARAWAMKDGYENIVNKLGLK